LENRGSKNDKVSRRVWKVVETGTREIRVGKAEGRKSKRKDWNKEGEKR